jgi:prepilin-type N-terminal cleavage/methylation domain-containing protein
VPFLGRRGFTLVELLVALVLLGIVSAGVYKVLLTNQRLYQSQTQRIDVQQNLRAAATIFAGEFRELDAVDGDIRSMTATAIEIRAMRQLAFICNAPVLGAGLNFDLTVRAAPLYGSRNFVANSDSLLIFYEGNEASRLDDAWHLAKLTAVTNLDCLDGKPGWKLSGTIAAVPANLAGGVTVGSPVRGFEVIKYLAYQASDSKWYVGLQNSAGVTQPLIGPIIANAGLTFTYYKAGGAVTAVPAEVVRIGITVREETAQPVQRGGVGGGLITKVDSLTTQVTLRNNPRF